MKTLTLFSLTTLSSLTLASHPVELPISHVRIGYGLSTKIKSQGDLHCERVTLNQAPIKQRQVEKKELPLMLLGWDCKKAEKDETQIWEGNLNGVLYDFVKNSQSTWTLKFAKSNISKSVTFR
ncbi:MAG: hypothetical protein HYR96_02915 [Deltaproteobacteria bacterium]|nr:hypothetical protein [Deltaproteobacteria bacterium]MBI3294051.1 hypothetical protein [Deltaproteobacteria bacterium]